MEPTRSSGAAGSGNSGTYTPEAAESLRFEEEIQSLMRDSLIQHGLDSPPASGGGSSFTALLGLPPTQAVELLHESEQVHAAPVGGEMWREKALRIPFSCSPTFPSNTALVERAARYSVFAAEDSAAAPSNSGGGERSSPLKPKVEPADYGDVPICQIPVESPHRPGKRKDAERIKGKGGKKNRVAEEDTGGDKLPYVHVRARRGQATDSHSLAERARREKINARMKLLQELVPGCSKITGTALVLDEIINHVQSLQRQVEFLSMRLAAVNPMIDFSGLDSFLSAECGRVGMEQPVWSDGRWQQQQQHAVWHVDMVQQQQQVQEQGEAVCWERGVEAPPPHEFINPAAAASLYVGSLSLTNQLKTEL